MKKFIAIIAIIFTLNVGVVEAQNNKPQKAVKAIKQVQKPPSAKDVWWYILHTFGGLVR